MKTLKKRGFSLVEVIMAAAVLVLVFGAGFIAMISMAKTTVATKMEDRVRRKFIAVESRIRNKLYRNEAPYQWDTMTWASRDETGTTDTDIVIHSKIDPVDKTRVRQLTLTATYKGPGGNTRTKKFYSSLARLEAKTQGARVRIRVIYEDATPLDNTDNVYVKGARISAEQEIGSFESSCFTGVNGDCELSNVKVGSNIAIFVNVNGTNAFHWDGSNAFFKKSFPETTTAGTLLDLALTSVADTKWIVVRPYKKMYGYLYDDGTTNAVANAKMYIHPKTTLIENLNLGKSVLETTTDSTGRFEYPALIPGDYWMYVIGNSQWTAVTTGEVKGTSYKWIIDHPLWRRSETTDTSINVPNNSSFTYELFDNGNSGIWYSKERGDYEGTVKGITWNSGTSLLEETVNRVNNLKVTLRGYATILNVSGETSPINLWSVFAYWTYYARSAYKSGTTNSSGVFTIYDYMPIILSTVWSFTDQHVKAWPQPPRYAPSSPGPGFLPAFLFNADGNDFSDAAKVYTARSARNKWTNKYYWYTRIEPWTKYNDSSVAHAIYPDTNNQFDIHMIERGTMESRIRGDIIYASGPENGYLYVNGPVIRNSGSNKFLDYYHRVNETATVAGGPYDTGLILLPSAGGHKQSVRFSANIPAGTVSKKFDGEVTAWEKIKNISGDIVFSTTTIYNELFDVRGYYYQWNSGYVLDNNVKEDDEKIEDQAILTHAYEFGPKTIPNSNSVYGSSQVVVNVGDNPGIDINVTSDVYLRSYILKFHDPDREWAMNLPHWGGLGFSTWYNSMNDVYRRDVSFNLIGKADFYFKIQDLVSQKGISGVTVKVHRTRATLYPNHPPTSFPPKTYSTSNGVCGACPGLTDCADYQLCVEDLWHPLPNGINFWLFYEKTGYHTVKQSTVSYKNFAWTQTLKMTTKDLTAVSNANW